MFNMIERGKRGGMTQVSTRHAIANNKYMKHYNPKQASKYLMYIDSNNLYGKSMVQRLPYKDFKWNTTLTEKNVREWKDTSNKGFILEVDLEYPQELHDLHNDYPLAPEKVSVEAEMLSPWTQDCYRRLKDMSDDKMIPDEKTQKLLLRLTNKEKYVVHIKTLQLYLQLGMKLKGIHRVVEFTQEAWMKPWIEFNTKNRQKSKSDFEKDLWKLMNNACFGKTMENVRDHVEFELVSTSKKYLKLTSKETWKIDHRINENLVGVELVKEEVLLNKPIAVGVSICELAKHHMYSFFYKHLKPYYGERVKMLYTDTDSFVLEVRTDDVYEDWKSDKLKAHFDWTDSKVLGLFKDELDGNYMTEFIALKPKLYSFKTEEKEKVVAKGVPKAVAKKEIFFNSFKQTLEEQKVLTVNTNSLRSQNHRMYVLKQEKLALTNFDNKRWYIDAVNSYAYGHYKTQDL
jgi:hypothetical protein